MIDIPTPPPLPRGPHTPSLADSLRNATLDITVQVEGLRAELLAALRQCRKHHEESGPLRDVPRKISEAPVIPPFLFPGSETGFDPTGVVPNPFGGDD